MLLARIFDLTATGALYALLLFAPLAYGSVHGWPLAVVELLALLAALTWFLKMIAEGELALVRSPLGLPCLLFVGVVLLQIVLGNGAFRGWALSNSSDAQLPSIFFSGSLAPASTRHALWLLLSYAAVYFLVINQLRDRAHLDWLVRFLLIFGSLMAFYGLVEYLSGSHGIFGWSNPHYTGRLTGTFVNPDHFAAWLAMLIPLGLGYLLSTKLLRRQRTRHSVSEAGLSLRDSWISDKDWENRSAKKTSHESGERFWQEILLLFGITIMAVAVIFTLSRGGVVSFLLSLLALVGLLLARQVARRSHLLLSIFVLTTLVYGAWIGLGPVLGRFGVAVADFQDRLTQYWVSIPMLVISPIFGTGLGTYGDLFPRFQPIELSPETIHYTHAHNDHLQFWIEGGIVSGLILLLALWRIGRDLVWAHLLGLGRCLHPAVSADDVYPVPQNAPHVSAGMNPVPTPPREKDAFSIQHGWNRVNVLNLPEGQSPKATNVSPWYGVYRHDPYNVGIAIGAIVGALAVLFHSFLDFSLRIPANGILLATLLGIATVALHTRFYRGAVGRLVSVWRCRLGGFFVQLSAGIFAIGFALFAVFTIVIPLLAEARLQAALASMASPPSTAGITPSLIQQLERQRESLRLLDRVISLAPGNLAARRLRASKLEELAGRAWNGGVGSDGQLLETREARAKVALALFAQAEGDYRRALSDAPYEAALHERLAWLLGNRAIILRAQSNEQASLAAEVRRLALTHFDRAIRLNPANSQRHRVLALFAFSQARLDFATDPLHTTALSAARSAVQLKPELLPELLDRALALPIKRADLQALVPDFPVDHLYLATLLEKKGLRVQAEAGYQKAFTLASPGEQPLYRRLYAQALRRSGKLPEALSELEIALKFDPEDPEIHLAIAELLSSMGDDGRALAEYEIALRLANKQGDGPLASQRSGASGTDGLPPRRRLLVKLVHEQLGLPTSRAYSSRFALARFYTKRGRYSLAIPLWETVVRENPADAAAHFHLALALDGTGAWQAAFKAYKQALELDRTNREYRAHFAERLFDNDSFFQAIQLWQAILAREPTDLKTRLRLAQAYHHVGELRDAVREYERLLQFYPGHGEARKTLATLRSRLPRR